VLTTVQQLQLDPLGKALNVRDIQIFGRNELKNLHGASWCMRNGTLAAGTRGELVEATATAAPCPALCRSQFIRMHVLGLQPHLRSAAVCLPAVCT
jgi:hypothetical protein